METLSTEHKAEMMRDIHASIVNGQRKQVVQFIEDYGLADFWPDYASFLQQMWGDCHEARRASFEDIVITYFRLTA